MSERTPEWRPVVGYEGRYEVSDAGDVRSLLRGGRMLSRNRLSMGYRSVRLTKTGVPPLEVKVHRLVLEAFVGPLPEGMVTRHLDGDHLNNELSNLAYGTYAENAQDTVRHGANYYASRTTCPAGHPYDAVRRGGRRCRTCHREWSRKAYLKSRGAVAA